MTRRFFCKVLLVVVAILGLQVLSGVLSAQGRSEEAFEHVKDIQDRYTENFLSKKGVVGTAVGLDKYGQHVVIVLLEGFDVSGIPQELEGIQVKKMVTGKIYALSLHPKRPRVLIAKAFGENQINLKWKENPETDVVYNVYRSLTSGGGYGFLDSTPVNLSKSTPSDGYGTPSSSPVTATLGLHLQKYGRTTGLTNGKIVGINATVNVGYDTGVAQFVNQIIIRPDSFSAGGDSGSLVVTQDQNPTEDKRPVGLLFAGSASTTIANPINAVLNRFGVTVDGERWLNMKFLIKSNKCSYQIISAVACTLSEKKYVLGLRFSRTKTIYS